MWNAMNEGPSVRYYCTAGAGMEPFLTAEVKRKLAAKDVCQIPGKVLFSSSAGISRVTELKAAERLFLLLKHDSPLRLSTHTSPAKAASVLQSRLLGDGNQWSSAVLTWSRLQEELSDRKTTLSTSNAARSVPSNREERGRGREEERCNVETGKSAGEQSQEESGTTGVRSGEEEAQAVEKKRKRQEEGELARESCGVKAQAREKKNKRENEEESARDKLVEKEGGKKREDKDGDEEERIMVLECSRPNVEKGIIPETGSVCIQTTTAPNHNVESSCKKTDHMAEDCTVENVEPGNTTGGENTTRLQPSRIKPETTSSVPVSFRISCKCTGSLSRCLSAQEVSKVIGVGLCRLLGWKTDLRNPQLEVNVHLSDDLCLLGIPLTRLPLANRSYIRTTGLRSTVAWAMASLAQIQPGSCVVDPMCGVGTILSEAAQEHKNAYFLGVDIDDRQLQKANENIEFAKMGNRMHLLKASTMMLPLPSASVDAVVCDLPFGRKFGTKTNMAANLPVIVTEMERVLCVGGTLVLLLSPQLSCLLKKLLAQKDTGPSSNQETTQAMDTHTGSQLSRHPPLSSLKHQATLRVGLGTIDGLIHKYVKIDA